jgi:hypothetical protein
LGIFLHEIEEKRAFFTLGLRPIFGPKNAVGKSLKVKGMMEIPRTFQKRYLSYGTEVHIRIIKKYYSMWYLT